MPPGFSQKPHSQDGRLAAWKITAFQYLICVVFLALLGGYWRLQVDQHRYYLQESDRNRIRNLPVIAPRGKILDREGRLLVDNMPAFSVLLSRENAAALTADRVRKIALGLGLNADDAVQLVERTARLPHYEPV